MNRKSKIVSIYCGVAVLSVIMVTFFVKVGAGVPDSDLPAVTDTGKEQAGTFFPIREDIALTTQDGRELMLSEIRGEVTVLAEFFAVCPHCAQRNGIELQEIYKRFGDHPDFRIVCITVDPETDGLDELKAYAEVFQADPEKWWFATAGDKAKTHAYLEQVLGFFGIRERTDPVDIGSNGRYAHDLGFLVIDRDFNVLGKWPLADARSDEGRALDPGAYERLKEEMYERIESELAKDDE